MTTKQFLIAFAVVYAILAAFGTVMWGPPGYSSEYMDEHKAEHERYIEIVKSDGYKHWLQRPKREVIEQAYERNPGMKPPLEELMPAVAFAEEYEQEPFFVAEKERQATYTLYFEFLNWLAVMVIVVKLGRKPLLEFLDDQAAKVRRRIEKARTAREEAEQRRGEAEQRVARLDQDRQEIEKQNEARIAQELEEIREGTEYTLEQLRAEAEERKRAEEHQAAMRMKAELVTAAIDKLKAQLRESASQDRQTALVHEFVNELHQAQTQRAPGNANG